AGAEPRVTGRKVMPLDRVLVEELHERDHRAHEGDRRGRRRDPAGDARRNAHAAERDHERRRERREQADPGGRDHPRRVCSLSTSSGSRRRDIATISPRPTTTSDAATAITAIAKICPAPSPCWRENEIRARLPPLSMISSESSTISGERRSSTPSAPIAKRIALMARYQVTSGPCIVVNPRDASRVVAEDHA